jgi:hypothetical protein
MTKVLFEILIIKVPPLLNGNVITRNGYEIQNAGSLSKECLRQANMTAAVFTYLTRQTFFKQPYFA